MSNRYACLGFKVEDADQLNALARIAATQGELLAAGADAYIMWKLADGTELTLWIEDRKRLVGVHPHFSGSCTRRVRIEEWIFPPEESRLARRAYAWASAADTFGHPFPLVFELPDGSLYDDLALPVDCEVQLAAFADYLQAFSTEEFLAHQKAKQIELTPHSFVPTGMFTPEHTPELWHALAYVRGRVLSTEMLRNQLTADAFVHVRMATSGGELDVVANPADVIGTIAVGGFIQGSFWLSGRLRRERLSQPYIH